MPPFTRTEREEADFMDELLNGAVGSFSGAKSSRASVDNERQPTRKQMASKPKDVSNMLANDTLQDNIDVLVVPKTPVKSHRIQDVDISQLMEGAEDWDWDDMNADFLSPKRLVSPKKALSTDAPPDYRPDTCTRCVVKGVDEFLVNGCLQKRLVVEARPDIEHRCVILQDDWIDADIRVGDVINVIGDFVVSPSSSSSAPIPTITVNSKFNLFIQHPDLLITATSLSSAPQCRRKPLISNLVRGSVDVTPSLVWGNMLHEVMQACLRSGRWDEQWIESRITEEIEKGLGELMRVNVSVEQARIEMRVRAKGLRAFAEKYISQKPKSYAILTNTRAIQGQTSLLAISKSHDIEEDMWSPTYGLKGKVDASVEVVISEVDDNSSPFTKAAPKLSTQSWTMPFEIKTGRAIAGMEHRAQTMLYTLLMAERYNTVVPSGLLYYTRNDEVVRVPAVRNEVRALLIARNDMAGYMMRRIRWKDGAGQLKQEVAADDGEDEADTESFLPPTIDDAWQCGKCYALDTCMLYRKAVENVVDTTSPIADIYALKTSHLSDVQAQFFKQWEALISLEEQDLVRFKKELWTMGAQEREKHGRCFSSMTLDLSYCAELDESQVAPPKEAKIHRFTYRFLKNSSAPSASLLNGHMSRGDAITVSVEPNLLALAKGFIVDLTPHTVVVGVDHEINPDTIRTLIRSRKHSHDEVVIFRIDKDELYGGMGRIRDNLAQLFYVDGDTRRLQLVVDLMTPRFDEEYAMELPTVELTAMAQLNYSQRLAATKVLSAQDYALILGMPGTGKTTVIAAIIQQLVSMGKTVLLASYTHSAVDTILLKLKRVADFGILRLGNLDKIHPDVHEFTLANRRVAINIEQLEQQVMTPPVVATTCLSIDHPLFSRRKFDYCIVDEASQITLPTCLGPLRFADKFVLVGDHFQLPPLVRTRAARKGGLDISLFRRLSDAHPHAVIDLTEQYRMNEDIMLLSNKLIYNDRLRCGSETVATRSLVLPDRTFIRSMHANNQSACQDQNGRCWLSRLMDESCKAVFVDTDAVPASDSRVGDLVENHVEAHLVREVAECLIRSGVCQNQIGILSLYRQQIKLLSYLLQDRAGVEILTADRSQGRDKDCIIISMVRSNNEGQVGDLMKDWRRMNVAFTRARSKLIIFGSRKTLESTPLLKDFFGLMESKDWILRLPANAHEMHGIFTQPSKKRSTEEAALDTITQISKENAAMRPLKKGKTSITAGDGLLKGRPILKELANATR